MNTARSASSRQLVVLNSLIRIASPLSPCRNFPFIAPRLNSPQELFVLNELRRIPAETHLCTVTSHGSSAGHCLFMVETVSAGPPRCCCCYRGPLTTPADPSVLVLLPNCRSENV